MLYYVKYIYIHIFAISNEMRSENGKCIRLWRANVSLPSPKFSLPSFFSYFEPCNQYKINEFINTNPFCSFYLTTQVPRNFQ